MPSRLSSLLVRDGLVGVKRMEKAFQRQVIYGGSLDTILLEMGLVPEERLTQYLALASGLPPAARDEGSVLATPALDLVSRELAELYRAVPLALAGEVVRILVCAPLEINALEDLADMLDRPLQPLITPEYRWHLVFAAAYGLDPPARFTTLARGIDVDATAPPVGRARSIIIEDPPAPRPSSTRLPTAADAPHSGPVPTTLVPSITLRPPASPAEAVRSLAPIAPEQATSRFDAATTPDALPLADPPPAIGRTPAKETPFAAPLPPILPLTPSDEAARIKRSTLIGISVARLGDGVPEEAKPTVRFVDSSSTGVPRPVADSQRSKRPSAKLPTPSPPSVRPKRAPTAPIDAEGRDAPLAVAAARELLATAEDRDSIFLTLLRAVRSRARWAGLLTVQGGAAIGRVALGETGLDIAAINTVLIPLDAVSPFRTVVTNQQPHVGALVSGDPSIDSMVLRFGGTVPPSALILPIVLRERVVALVVAHRVSSDLRLVDVTELLPLATAAADSISRLIVKSKSAGYRAPSAAPVIELDAEVDTKRINRAPAEWKVPDQVVHPPSLELGTEVSFTAEPQRPIDVVLGEIETAPEGHAEDQIADAVDRAPEALGELMRRFPGRLRVDRFAVNGRPLRATQYGGLLELVVRLGSVASELLIEKMGAAQRDVRFYATVCTAELRPRNAVFALVERVFDQDFGVRACAIEALAGYPVLDLRHALVRARRAIHSEDPETVAAATTAVVELGDVDAIPDLIGAIERGDRAAEHANRALISLTAQDFGASERKWRKWWDGARKRHRVEWLIEGLAHKEDAIREDAINDLRRLTGEYFGYHYDLPKKERDVARERWAAWWREVGQRRFVAIDDERLRPTAMLPARKD